MTKLDKSVMRQNPSFPHDWQAIPGQAVDISAGGEGTVMMINDSEEENIMIWNEILQQWNSCDGTGKAIAVGPKGNPYMCNENKNVFWSEHHL